jgi:putative FmdB family regulatory protein
MIYEYKCSDCQHIRELEYPMGVTAKIPRCPECDGQLLRLFSAPPIHFKGEGWASK